VRIRTFGHGHLADVIDKPQDDPEAEGDPYKTLFISRLVGITDTINVSSLTDSPKRRQKST
jgi:hypothetical protein